MASGCDYSREAIILNISVKGGRLIKGRLLFEEIRFLRTGEDWCTRKTPPEASIDKHEESHGKNSVDAVDAALGLEELEPLRHYCFPEKEGNIYCI